MNKKGFTLIELLVSISLVSLVAYFLFQIIFVIRDIYAEKTLKSELYIETSNVTNIINKDITTKLNDDIKLINANKISDDILNIVYSDGSIMEVKIDRLSNKISYGTYSVDILKEAKIGSIKLYYNYDINDLEKNGVFYVKIPVSLEKYNQDFSIYIYSRYDSSYALIGGELTNLPINTCEYENGHTWTFDYTGDVQDFTVPCDGTYKVELWGASGGQIYAGYSLGGYTSGELFLARRDVLYFYVGEKGNANRVAAWNGGGYGGYYDGKSGGGATDIRYFSTNPTTQDLAWDSDIGLNSRIMVAAGGGGDGSYNYSGQNSSAGGLVGYRGNYYQGHGDNRAYGFGGTQTAGGENGNNVYGGTGSSLSSGFGYGASTNNVSSNAVNTGSGGGGGGYYGGGAGGATQSGGAGHSGGGGSSYISGHAGCLAIAKGSTTATRALKDGCTSSSTSIECSTHYSGLKFTNTEMIDGQGYAWTTTKAASSTGMPTHDGTSTMMGNTGNGYAKITLVIAPGNSQSSTPTQVVNYTMLYDGTLGDATSNQMSSITGGWNPNSDIRFGGCGGDGYNLTYSHNPGYMYTYTVKNSGYNYGGGLYTANQITLDNYNGLYRISTISIYRTGSASMCYHTGGGRFCYNGGYCDESVGTTKLGYSIFGCSINVTGSYTIGVGTGTCGDGSVNASMNTYDVWLTKADNWQELASKAGLTVSSISDLLTQSSTLLANKSAVEYMIYNCTGDFMTMAVSNSTFTTALDSSTYKNMIYGNEHWNKFLTMAGY